MIPGNTDPWAGPVDPEAVERENARWRRQQNSRAAQRENAADACGCGQWDCAECGARRADGWRPPKGSARRAALHHDAAMQRARERWHGAQQAVTP